MGPCDFWSACITYIPGTAVWPTGCSMRIVARRWNVDAWYLVHHLHTGSSVRVRRRHKTKINAIKTRQRFSLDYMFELFFSFSQEEYGAGVRVWFVDTAASAASAAAAAAAAPAGLFVVGAWLVTTLLWGHGGMPLTAKNKQHHQPYPRRRAIINSSRNVRTREHNDHTSFSIFFRSSYFSGDVFLLCSRTRYASTWFAYLDSFS